MSLFLLNVVMLSLLCLQAIASTLADPARAGRFLMQLPQGRQESIWPWSTPAPKPHLPPAIAFAATWWHGLGDEVMDSICWNLDALGYRPMPSSGHADDSVDFIHLCALQNTKDGGQGDAIRAVAKPKDPPPETSPSDQLQPVPENIEAASSKPLQSSRDPAKSTFAAPDFLPDDACTVGCRPHAFKAVSDSTDAGLAITDQGPGTKAFKWTNRRGISLSSRLLPWLFRPRPHEDTFEVQIQCCCEDGRSKDRCLKVYSIKATHDKIPRQHGRHLYVEAATLAFELPARRGQQARAWASLGTGYQHPDNLWQRWLKWRVVPADIRHRTQHTRWSLHLGFRAEASPSAAALESPSADLQQQTEDHVFRLAGEQRATHVVELSQSQAAFKVIHNLREEVVLGSGNAIGRTVSFNADNVIQSNRMGPLLYHLTNVSPPTKSWQKPAVQCPRILLSATIHTVRLAPRDRGRPTAPVWTMSLHSGTLQFDQKAVIHMQDADLPNG